MQKPYTEQLFPGYRISPDGTDYRLFEREEDVPSGWLRETPDSFAKKGLGEKRHAKPSHPAPAAHEEETPSRKPGRPKKDVEVDL